MAKFNPNIPTIDIKEVDTLTGYILKGTCEGTPATTAGYFAIGCELQDVTTGTGTFINTGTVAAPVWNNVLVVDSAEIDASLIKTRSVSLTAAQIIALFTTSVEVIPAVAGKAIILDSFVFDLTGTATQFTGGGVVNLQYKNTANGAGTTLHADIAATVVQNATARVITQRIPKDLSATAVADIVGQGVYIGAKTANFAAGTGTAICKVNYHTI